MTDERIKKLTHKAKGKLINQRGVGRRMEMWIIDFGEREVIIRRDWLRSMKSMINWEKGTLKLEEIQVYEIPDWLDDLQKVFEDFPKKELLLKRPEVDHVIVLK